MPDRLSAEELAQIRDATERACEAHAWVKQLRAVADIRRLLSHVEAVEAENARLREMSGDFALAMLAGFDCWRIEKAEGEERYWAQAWVAGQKIAEAAEGGTVGDAVRRAVRSSYGEANAAKGA